MNKPAKIWTLPNLLSLLRLLLIVPIVLCYALWQRPLWATVLLCLSCATDVADGYIARHFAQESRLGKMLDPIADKTTQGVVVLLLLLRLPRMGVLLGCLAFKEISIGILTLLLLKRAGAVYSARWYGKLATLLTNTAMIVHFALPNLPAGISWALIALSSAALVCAQVLYAVRYAHFLRAARQAAKAG